jgi:hypothetical protein
LQAVLAKSLLCCFISPNIPNFFFVLAIPRQPQFRKQARLLHEKIPTNPDIRQDFSKSGFGM